MQALLALFLLLAWFTPSLHAQSTPVNQQNISTDVSLEVDGVSVTAHFPDGVANIISTPHEHPTLFQGSIGNESTQSASFNFDTYSLQLVDAPTLAQLKLSEPVTLDDFLNAQLELLKSKYNVTVEEDLPQTLKAANAGNPNDRYVWLYAESTLGKPIPKQFLWRILLINGHVVLAQRELGAGAARKYQVDPSDEQAWEFLKSVKL